MSAKITLENWKEFKGKEASELFTVDEVVKYKHGFTRFSDYVGQVTRVTSAGVVYVKEVELEFVERNKLEREEDCQMGGWKKYDPSKIISKNDEELRFMPTLESHYKNYISYDPEHPIIWKGNERSGLWNLKPIKLDEKGLVKLTYASVMD